MARPSPSGCCGPWWTRAATWRMPGSSSGLHMQEYPQVWVLSNAVVEEGFDSPRFLKMGPWVHAALSPPAHPRVWLTRVAAVRPACTMHTRLREQDPKCALSLCAHTEPSPTGPRPTTPAAVFSPSTRHNRGWARPSGKGGGRGSRPHLHTRLFVWHSVGRLQIMSARQASGIVTSA